jgi:hypothetical protein
MSALHYLMFGEWPTVEYLKFAIIVKLIILALLLPFVIHIIKKEEQENEKPGGIDQQGKGD